MSDQQDNPLHAEFNRILRQIQETPRMADDETDVPLCETCQGQGQLAIEIEPGIVGVKFPKYRFISCPDCKKGQERQQQILDNRMRRTHLPDRYIRASFRDWGSPLHENRAGKVAAYFAAREFAHHPQHQVSTHRVAKRLLNIYDDPPAWIQPNALNWVQSLLAAPDKPRSGLVLYGPRGVGKTWIAAAAMNAIAEQGDYVLYMRMSHLIQTLRDTWKSDEQTGQLLEHYCTVPILFVDDMSDNTADPLPLSPHMQDFAATIMRDRMGNFRPTLITTNWKPETFTTKWGGVCADVVLEGCHWIPVTGVNLRDLSSQWGEL